MPGSMMLREGGKKPMRANAGLADLLTAPSARFAISTDATSNVLSFYLLPLSPHGLLCRMRIVSLASKPEF